MSMAQAESSSSSPIASSSPSSLASTSKKRKRSSQPVEELEVDIDAPEPPSKKALRKAKKGKSTTSVQAPRLVINESPSDSEVVVAPPLAAVVPQRSEHGIWIGNLPWGASKETLRKFLVENADIENEAITRIHMPVPKLNNVEAVGQRVKPQNKGFAYVDFATEAALDAAMALSETLFSGRRVLIKNAKSFEGRPDRSREDGEKTVAHGNPPSKRIFVGNLSFDTTREELSEHFARCGEVADAFVATFEDTGKCKGYAWITFESVESAEKAVRGWIELEPEQGSGSDGDQDEGQEVNKASKSRRKSKVRKWWINRIKGRPLRMEFAEDKAVRYKKRYGKGGIAKREKEFESQEPEPANDAPVMRTNVNGASKSSPKDSKPVRERKAEVTINDRYRKKVDARTIKPGAALAEAPRLTGAIIPGQGKKITFE